MNLPIINDRTMTVQKESTRFSLRMYKEIFTDEAGLGMDEVVNLLSQMIINLNSDEKKILNATHEKAEIILEEASKENGLTYGEKVRMLSSMILGETKYIIRWERHGSFEKEGDFE